MVAQPLVVLVRVLRRRRHQLDHRTERPLRTQNRPLARGRRLTVPCRWRKNPSRESRPPARYRAGESLTNTGPFSIIAADRLGDFRLAAARYGARFVAENAVRARCHQTPRGPADLLFETDLRAPGQHVSLSRRAKSVCATRRRQLPPDAPFPHAELGVLRDIENPGILRSTA